MNGHRCRVAIALTNAAACLLLSHPGIAIESAEVTRAEGWLRRSATSDSSPVPACWIEWEHDDQDGNEFSATLVDHFSHEWCSGELTVRCTPDSLAYGGWWLEQDVTAYPFFRRMSLHGTLKVELTVTAATIVTASRQWSGDIEIARHEVTLTTPDGVATAVLPAATPPDQMLFVLQPGVYGLRIDFAAVTYNHQFGAYDGAVTITWVDASTPAAAANWGTVKALYR